jgi:predicted GIY-YIG superfamily endonuclease
MHTFYYVYILTDVATESHYYVGYTTDLNARIEAHNSGKVPHTSKYKPWKLTTYTAFSCKQKAIDFERYLKSHSGRAFASKHY